MPGRTTSSSDDDFRVVWAERGDRGDGRVDVAGEKSSSSENRSPELLDRPRMRRQTQTLQDAQRQSLEVTPASVVRAEFATQRSTSGAPRHTRTDPGL